MLKKYVWFVWFSRTGGSTYQASIRKNIKNIYSVESDITWQKKLKETIINPNINYIYNEMDTHPSNWGHPGKNATDIQKKIIVII